MRLLEEYVRSLLGEMSREMKIDHREKYNHPGLVKDALYMHWIFGSISEKGMSELRDKLKSFDNFEDKKKYFLNHCLDVFRETIEKIKRGEELSCNLIDPDKSEGVGTNYSGGGIDPWGYIGLILKPKVVTMAFDMNVGIDVKSVDNNKLRKVVRPSDWRDPNRDEELKISTKNVRKKFPLEDEGAYRKSYKSNPEKEEFFYYDESEFVIVPERVVGVVWLGGEFYFEEMEEEIENLFEEKKKFEKDYLKRFCNSSGIKFYEVSGRKIFDIPRLQSDLSRKN